MFAHPRNEHKNSHFGSVKNFSQCAIGCGADDPLPRLSDFDLPAHAELWHSLRDFKRKGVVTVQLTSKERIMRIFRGEPVDRPAFKLWGAGPVGPQLHPSYQKVSELAFETTDLFIGAGFPFHIYFGAANTEYEEVYYEDTKDPLWKNRHCLYHTPKGDLHGVERVSVIGDPSYTVEYLCKQPSDIEAILSLPYKPAAVDRKAYDQMVSAVGDRGVVMPALDHAGYALQRILGSENLALFSVDHRDLLLEATKVFSERILDHAKQILSAGIRAPFQWVGPEVFLPPLMGPNDFEDFVYRFDRPLCDEIHSGGGYVWVHSHNKVSNFIPRFIDMGVDVLNPLEPPKNGDVTLCDAVAAYGDQIGWEGNIEIQELLQAEPKRLTQLIDDCVRAGSESGRFILCPSAGYMEYANPSERYINNLMLYLRHGLECVERYRK